MQIGENWFKSSYSTDGSGCVEVCVLATAVKVRDSKDRSGGTLTFVREDWTSFLGGVAGA